MSILLALACSLLAWIGPSFGNSFVATEGSYQWQFATYDLDKPDEFVIWLVYSVTIQLLVRMATKMKSDRLSSQVPLVMAIVLFGTLVSSSIHSILAFVLYGFGLFLEPRVWVMTFVTSLIAAVIALFVPPTGNDTAADVEKEKKVEPI